MSEVCTNFSCRQRHRCKKALIIEEFSKVKPYTPINGFCTGFEEILPEGATSRTWLDKLFDWKWHFC